MIQNFEAAFEQMHQAFNQTFKAGSFWNVQLKLLTKYIVELIDNPTQHNRINLNSKAYQEFGLNMEHVLISLGFNKDNEELVYQGDIQQLTDLKEQIIKVIEDNKYFSFGEISEIVTKGEKPPGIKTINDSPIEAPHSQSTLEKPLKPWERSPN